MYILQCLNTKRSLYIPLVSSKRRHQSSSVTVCVMWALYGGALCDALEPGHLVIITTLLSLFQRHQGHVGICKDEL